MSNSYECCPPRGKTHILFMLFIQLPPRNRHLYIIIVVFLKLHSITEFSKRCRSSFNSVKSNVIRSEQIDIRQGSHFWHPKYPTMNGSRRLGNNVHCSHTNTRIAMIIPTVRRKRAIRIILGLIQTDLKIESSYLLRSRSRLVGGFGDLG